MPTRLDFYRVRDGLTRLDERFFNRVFGDIDVRLSGLEELRLSWQEAVRTVVQFGLARIDSVMAEPLQALDTNIATGQAKVAHIETLRTKAVAAVAALSATIASLQDDTLADLDAWKATRLAELNAWMASLASALPGIHARLDALESSLDDLDVPDEVTAAAAPALGLPQGPGPVPAGTEPGQVLVLPDFGLYQWDPASTAASDGEICLAPHEGAGRWWLIAPSWDFLWAHLAGVLDDLQSQLDQVNAAAVASTLAAFTVLQGSVTAGLAAQAAKVLQTTATLDFPAIAAGVSQALTLPVAGAVAGEAVIVTPPPTLAGGLLPTAWVSAADTVTVSLRNTTASAIDPAAMTWRVVVLKP